MKKIAKQNPKPAEPAANPETANEESAAADSPPVKLTFAERVRQRVEASRHAALNKAVAQSPD